MNNYFRFAPVVLVVLLLQGCFGVGIDTAGKRQVDITNPMLYLSKQRVIRDNRSVYLEDSSRPQTASGDLLVVWGRPDSYECQKAGKEVWTYKQPSPAGATTILYLVIPIPIWWQDGSDEVSFEIVDGVVTMAHIQVYRDKFACYAAMIMSENDGSFHPEATCGDRPIRAYGLLTSPTSISHEGAYRGRATHLDDQATKQKLCGQESSPNIQGKTTGSSS
jgi:hypothetical protein